MLISLKPVFSSKRAEILKKVSSIDSGDIQVYAIDMQHLQKKLRDIDSGGGHYDSKLPAHNWDYCDKNSNTKDPEGMDEISARRKARQEKKGSSGKPSSKSDEMTNLMATVAAQKKLLSIKEEQSKA